MKLAMFEHVIFDFDGVISDSFQVACEEFNRTVSQGYPTIPLVQTQDDLAFVYSGPLKTSLRRFGLTDAESEKFFNEHSAAMQKRSSTIQPFNDVLGIISKLLPGRCSIVTSSYSDAVLNILKKSPNYFDGLFLYISGRELRQPKSTKIRDILSAVNVSAERAIHIADMVSDILYSRTVSVPCCVVGWGYHPLSYLSVFSPEFSVATPHDLSNFLRLNT